MSVQLPRLLTVVQMSYYLIALCAPVLQVDDQGLLPSKAEKILRIEKKIKI